MGLVINLLTSSLKDLGVKYHSQNTCNCKLLLPPGE